MYVPFHFFVSLPMPTILLQYLEENIGANDVRLSESEIAEVRKIVEEAVQLPGARKSVKDLGFALQDTPELPK